MLEPVALHHHGFKIPGLALDARGVAVGSHALVLLTGLERLVSFLRLLSEELVLDELLPGLRIERVRNRLGAQAYVVVIGCGESQGLDRLARVARLVQAPLGVGVGPHFVAYRDRRAPLGYDVDEIAAEPRDYTLYTAAFTQSYTRTGTLPFSRLLAQLDLLPLPGGARGVLAARAAGGAGQGPGATAISQGTALEDELWLTVPPGLLPRVLRYLWERATPAQVALLDAEAPPEPGQPPEPDGAHGPAGPDAALRGALVQLRAAPARVLALLTELTALPAAEAPRLFLPHGLNYAVELGHEHPLRLRGCQSVFRAEDVYLFTARRRGFMRVPAPRFVPAERLVTLHEAQPGSQPGAGPRDEDAPPPPGPPLRSEELRPKGSRGPSLRELRVALRLISQPTPARTPTGALIPWTRAEALRDLMYLLPEPLLGELRAFLADAGLFVISPAGACALPIGTPLYEPAPGVYLPLGVALTPRLPGPVLAAHLPELADSVLLVLPAGEPASGRLQALRVRRDAFSPLSHALLAPLDTRLRPPPPRADAESAEPQPAVVRNDPLGLFPLWGFVGDTE